MLCCDRRLLHRVKRLIWVGVSKDRALSPCGAHAELMRSSCGAHAELMRSSCGAHAELMRSSCGAHAEPMRSPCGAHASPGLLVVLWPYQALSTHLVNYVQGDDPDDRNRCHKIITTGYFHHCCDGGKPSLTRLGRVWLCSVATLQSAVVQSAVVQSAVVQSCAQPSLPNVF